MKLAANILTALLLAMLAVLPAGAQRRVTPVKALEPGASPIVEDDTPKIDPSRLVQVSDANGNVVLVDTVSGREVPDTVGGMLPPPPKMEYPLIYQLSVGVNFWDAAMRLFGQKHGIGDVWAELNMHNRYFPYIAAGAGNCRITPADKNFTFSSPVSPYFKVGVSYNFLYNSNPDYKLLLGVRYGLSSYKWNLYDVTVDEGYWNDPTHFDLYDRHNTAGHIEVLLGVRVKIVGPIMMGWNIVYQSVLHESAAPNGKPMFIPGFGKRSSVVTGNFSVIYNIPLNKKPSPAVEK